MIPYPNIDPVIFQIGPIAPRWYGLSYLLGFLYVYHLLKKYWRWYRLPGVEHVDTALTTLVLSLLVCSRLAYVLFYNLEETLAGPWWEVFAVWHGGLSFHGGAVGTLLGGVILVRKFGIDYRRIADVVGLAAPVGLGLGRIANFINGELWGRTTDVPWAMIFPGAGPLPRHPSQLYESILEGLVLWVILQLLWRRKPVVGTICGAFFTFYGIFRIFVEFFREPDAQVGFLLGGATMGQLLSVALLLFGVVYWYLAIQRGEAHDAPALKRK